MPAGNLPEEASLLGGDGPEELRNIQLSVSSVRSLVADGSMGDRQQVETEHGPITIAVAGDPTKPTILTYHDLGLSHITNYQSFFLYPEMRAMLSSFRVVSINAPGQQEGGKQLTEGYVYPSMEQLAETVERVRTHLSLRSFIGLGVGLGANVLARYGLLYPQKVDALLLVNCSAGTAGWIEWGYQKLNIRHLKAGQMTTASVDYLLWHHFGKVEQCSQDVVTVFRQHFERNLQASNLGLLIDSYIRRTDLGIVRELDPNKKKEARMLRCPVLNVTSNYSPHIDDTVAFNARLDPANSSWMKLQDCGLVLEEQPGKVVEAFRLFLQGQGYVVGSSRRASSVAPGHIQAINSRRLNCRQNSLPLIRDVNIPPPRPPPELSQLYSTAEDTAGAEDGSDDVSTNSTSTAVAIGGDGSANESAPSGDSAPANAQDPAAKAEVTVNVLNNSTSAAATNGNDKDIRITENPLEHPAV